MNLVIEDRTYHCPENWDQLSYSEYLRLHIFIRDNAPQRLKDFLLDKEFNKPITNDEELSFTDFYRRLLVEMTGIPEDLSKEIHVHGTEGLGIIPMANMLLKFMYIPNEGGVKIKKHVKVGDETFYLWETYEDMKGDPEFYKDQTFKVYEELQTIKQYLHKAEHLEIGALGLLTAIMYRKKGEDYDPETTKERAELFKSLPMSYVWGSYFFFRPLIDIWVESTNPYSNKEQERKERQIQS